MTPIRVLLVEDNPGDAELIRDALEHTELCLEIAVVPDGADALDHVFRRGRHAQAARPDLIVLDLNLPRLGGREVLAEIRQHPALHAIPIVIFTSSDSGHDISDSYRLGANCYVTKPVELAAFQAAIKAIEGFWRGIARPP
ncbi:MAG: response regulator [Deltaproteobacteria bacterium]|nr:MAG: response regulator [Deltaproteobacteria bacterium]TMQ23122.1 MAG: response regulator [Deltaproteobacteria bacterium]